MNKDLNEKYILSNLISYLDWDSTFFNLRIGRINLEKGPVHQIQQILSSQKGSGYDLIYLFVNNIDESATNYLEKNNVYPADIKITFKKRIGDPVHPRFSNIEPFHGPISSQLLRLVYESGHKSRFRRDPKLNSRFRELYRIWIEKSVDGYLADVVLVKRVNSSIGGFVTLKKNGNQGTIGLIAVDNKFRGKGIGSALMIEAENWCSKAGCNELIVATQAENLQACHFYKRIGFSETQKEHIFHLYKESLVHK